MVTLIIILDSVDFVVCWLIFDDVPKKQKKKKRRRARKKINSEGRLASMEGGRCHKLHSGVSGLQKSDLPSSLGTYLI
jgi:hypothetical protein